jgi:hypothetical protein
MLFFSVRGGDGSAPIQYYFGFRQFAAMLNLFTQGPLNRKRIIQFFGLIFVEKADAENWI